MAAMPRKYSLTIAPAQEGTILSPGLLKALPADMVYVGALCAVCERLEALVEAVDELRAAVVQLQRNDHA